MTRSCDLECTYCPVSKRPVHMAAGRARAAIRKLASRGGGLVRLTGGEPTMNWKAVSAAIDEVQVQRAARAEVSLELCTNGSGLSGGERLEKLRKPWIRVVLSLDGTPWAQAASGRRRVDSLQGLLGLPGVMVTQTIPPGLADRVLDNFLYIWELGARRLNFLPAYYVAWTAGQIRDLGEGLEAVASFLAPRVRRGSVEVRNLSRTGSVPLFNDDLTLDADGTWYRTNLVLADSITHPLLPALRGTDPETVPPLPRDIRGRLESILPIRVRRSARAVDRNLTRFVALLSGNEARPRGRQHRRTGRPERLELHLSYECTNRCAFCSEAHRMARWRKHPVSAIEVRRSILSHASAGGTHVNLTGGEPTLHGAFLYALELARSNGMRTYVGTNGARLADPAFSRRALPLVDELSLSIHGSTARVHDRSTGRRGSFDDIVATAGNARARPGIEIFANVVVTRQNFDDVPRVVDLCARLGVAGLLISNAAPEGRALDAYATLAVPLSAFRDGAEGLARRADEQGVRPRFFGLPLCVLGAAWMKSNDLFWDPRVTVERAIGPGRAVRMSNVSSRRPRRGRRYTRRCRGCRMKGLCGGVFSRYIDLFGDDGIEAIRD